MHGLARIAFPYKSLFHQIYSLIYHDYDTFLSIKSIFLRREKS